MARSLKDLLPSVSEARPSPSSPRQVTALGPDEAIFGGLELLLKTPPRTAHSAAPRDEQTVKTEAWSQGLLDAERLWQEQKAQDLKDLRAAFDQEKADLARMLQISMTGQIEQQFQEISAHLADTLAELLEPFLEEQTCALMIQRFSDVAKSAMDESIEATPVLKGPQDLLERLTLCQRLHDARTKAGEQTDPEDKTGAEQTELSLTIDKTVFETRLKPFVAQLREAIQDE